MDLTPRELMSLRILAFFFYQTGSYESAKRAVKSLLVLDPKNLWARGLNVLCENALENYENVLALTEDLSEFAQDSAQYKSLIWLRARSLQKTNRHREAIALMQKAGG